MIIAAARRRRALAGHDGRQDAAAGDRRAGAVEGAARHRFAAFDRADAARRSGRDDGDRRRRQCGAVCRAHRRARATQRLRSAWPQYVAKMHAAAKVQHARVSATPVKTIGVIGGGQLGRMFALDAKRMGYDVITLDPQEHSPTGQVADEQIVAAYDDMAAIEELGRRSDIVTYEFENIAIASVEHLERLGHRVRPSSSVLRVTQDRILEKTFVRECGIPTADFAPIERRRRSRAGGGDGRVSGGAENGARRLRRQRASGASRRSTKPKRRLRRAKGAAADFRALRSVRARAERGRDAQRDRRGRRVSGGRKRARPRRFWR